MKVLITLTMAGTNTGNFSIYSDADGYTTPIVTGVSKSALESGYEVEIPADSGTVRVKSTGDCQTFIDFPIQDLPITTTTTSSTTSTTTTLAPVEFSKITNNGIKGITGIIRKNGVDYVASFSVGTMGASYSFSLGGVTFGPTDSLTLTIASTTPYGGILTISNAVIYPNGNPALLPSNYTGQGTNEVVVTFNGLGGGWDVNPMTWFNIALSAS